MVLRQLASRRETFSFAHRTHHRDRGRLNVSAEDFWVGRATLPIRMLPERKARRTMTNAPNGEAHSTVRLGLMGNIQRLSAGSIGTRVLVAASIVLGSAFVFVSSSGAATVAPAAPTNATARLATGITVSWVDNSVDETGFVVERSMRDEGFGVIGTVGANVTSFSDMSYGITTYTYRVRARNDRGFSAYATSAPIFIVSTNSTDCRERDSSPDIRSRAPDRDVPSGHDGADHHTGSLVMGPLLQARPSLIHTPSSLPTPRPSSSWRRAAEDLVTTRAQQRSLSMSWPHRLPLRQT